MLTLPLLVRTKLDQGFARVQANSDLLGQNCPAILQLMAHFRQVWRDHSDKWLFEFQNKVAYKVLRLHEVILKTRVQPVREQWQYFGKIIVLVNLILFNSFLNIIFIRQNPENHKRK